MGDMAIQLSESPGALAEPAPQYRLPHDLGYHERRVASRGESVAFEAFPDVTFTVDELLG